ncbi:unnamed protein product, partial [Brenthis ino]
MFARAFQGLVNLGREGARRGGVASRRRGTTRCAGALRLFNFFCRFTLALLICVAIALLYFLSNTACRLARRKEGSVAGSEAQGEFGAGGAGAAHGRAEMLIASAPGPQALRCFSAVYHAVCDDF